MSKAEWTTEKPTVDGWYWCDEPGDDIGICEVKGCYAVFNSGREYDILKEFLSDTKWKGPIDPNA